MPADEATSAIRLKTVRYLPGRTEQSSIAAHRDRFTVIRVSDNAKVLEGHVLGPVENRDTRERL